MGIVKSFSFYPKSFFGIISCFLIGHILLLHSSQNPNLHTSETTKPNVVLIMLDDAGFGDFEPFGFPEYPTPNVKALSEEGKSFYKFYMPQAICSASRAALITGCFPGRTKVFAAYAPNDRGLDPKFATLGEVLQRSGYKTACVGKWHLGDHEETRPDARGFSESVGLMYSNDMWRYHPAHKKYWSNSSLKYWENGKVKIDTVNPHDQKMLTTDYTEYAVDFISRHKNEPFFLYLPHSMPHVPLYCSDKFDGKSGVGLYGDVMMELDWSVGQINQALKDNGVEENTILIFIVSDNGPWLKYGNHSGITPFREGKMTAFDGGIRNACIIKYPNEIEKGTKSMSMFSSVDILPTICRLTNSELPDHEIDGRDVWEIIKGDESASNPHDYYPISTFTEFQGIISGDGKWKMLFSHEYKTVEKGGKDGKSGRYVVGKLDTVLYNLVNDPQEKANVITHYPEVSNSLKEMANQHYQRFYTNQ